MISILKGEITQERVSKLSKRKRKKHRLNEFKELGFSFSFEQKDQEKNNKLLDLIIDYCEANNLALVGFSQPSYVSGIISNEQNYRSVDADQLSNFISYFLTNHNIIMNTSPLFDLNYDLHMYN